MRSSGAPCAKSPVLGRLAVVGAVGMVVTCGTLPGCAPADDGESPSVVTAPATTFPAPSPSATSRIARRACEDRSPEQVLRVHRTAARSGADAAGRRFLASAAKSDSPTSVPLAARVYSMTVKKSRRTDAYVACAHVLSVKEPK